MKQTDDYFTTYGRILMPTGHATTAFTENDL